MGRGEILCMGELLWDSLPAGLFLGGAPFNVAAHLNSLGLPVGMLSRVGRDRLGAEEIDRVARRGIATDLIQLDDGLPTGFVSVALEGDGSPAYDIAAPAAWDAIELSEGVLERAGQARAIVFGSLAQRSPLTRETIRRLCEIDVPKVFDVNLRPPFDDSVIVRESLLHADIVKLNEQELRQLSRWFDLPTGLRPAITAVADAFGCETVCVTRGGNGAVLLRRGRWTEHPGYRVDVIDAVGSGDAFLAAALSGLLAGQEDEVLLRSANLLGAYVATRSGAVPEYEEDAVARILAENGEPATDGGGLPPWAQGLRR